MPSKINEKTDSSQKDQKRFSNDVVERMDDSLEYGVLDDKNKEIIMAVRMSAIELKRFPVSRSDLKDKISQKESEVKDLESEFHDSLKSLMRFGESRGTMDRVESLSSELSMKKAVLVFLEQALEETK